MVAQTQKVLFLCNCCSTTLVPSLNDQVCCNGTPGRAKEAEWRQNRTIAKVAEGLPWSPNGGTVVATAIAQWTLSVGQRRHTGGTREAEALLKFIHNVHNITYFYGATNGRPLCIHSVCAFLLRATCERPTSSPTFVRLF